MYSFNFNEIKSILDEELDINENNTNITHTLSMHLYNFTKNGQHTIIKNIIAFLHCFNKEFKFPRKITLECFSCMDKTYHILMTEKFDVETVLRIPSRGIDEIISVKLKKSFDNILEEININEFYNWKITFTISELTYDKKNVNR